MPLSPDSEDGDGGGAGCCGEAFMQKVKFPPGKYVYSCT